ncbi:MAG TPA: EAL domain-containing protein [Longimicrobiales bacterium]|nr:EAL domain-containing protein [Longimicrobiales bacterium]
MQEVQQRTHGRSILTAESARALLLDPGAREIFGRPARLASLALRAPIAMVGVVHAERLVLVGHVGVPAPWSSTRQVPLGATFCRYVADTRAVFAVEDAARHPLGFSVARLDDFERVSYLGAPVVVEGRVVAVLSVCDIVPRRWTQDERTLIKDLATAVQRDLELLGSRFEWRAAAPIAPVGAAPDGMITVDAEWRFAFMNEHAQELLGRVEADLLGRRFWHVYPGLVGTGFHRESLRVTSDRVPIEQEIHCRSIDRWLEVRAYPTADGGAALHLRDVSARRAAQEELRGRESRYRRMFEESHTALFLMDRDGTLLEVNQQFESLTGRGRDELYRMRMVDLMCDPDAFDRCLLELREQEAIHDVELALRHADGRELACVVDCGSQIVEGDTVYAGALRDVTKDKEAQAKLVRSALHDALTGLPNRVVFMDRLERLLTHSQRRVGYGFAVLFLDLDNFKDINDSLGHLAGDELLVTVARRLESCVRQGDTVARIGGDEFAVLLDMVQDAAAVTFIVDRIRESLALPYHPEVPVDGMSASIGIAISVSGYERAEDLLRDADSAMYRAKASGRDDYVIFDSDMHERALAQRQLEDDLRTATAGSEFDVLYHPIVDLERGTVKDLEALVRWNHPTRGVLLPHEFMPLAEQTGLVLEIGWWVLNEACRQLRSWQLERPTATTTLTVSVNLSAKQFVHASLLDHVDEALLDSGLAPEFLRLDVTEAVVMQNPQLSARLLEELRLRGIQICIDDFGTGYTSLRELRQFPISCLKIDRSFVHTLGTESESTEIVQTIIALGRSMAIDAVAEGVETTDQLDQLRRLGTRYAQGYLFSMPVDAQAAAGLLVD